MTRFEFIFTDPDTGYMSGKKLLVYVFSILVLVWGVSVSIGQMDVDTFLKLMAYVGGVVTGYMYKGKPNDIQNRPDRG